jgi:hypothetical protein
LDQHQFYELLLESKPLLNGQKFGVFGENSLFWKILQRIVTDEQRVRLRSLDRDQKKRIIESALLNCEQTANRFVLAGETRRKFAELILEHGRVPRTVGQYGHFIVLLEANRLRDRVQPLLNESEWEKFEWQVGLAKRAEPELEGLGLWTARRSEPSDETADGAKN